MYNYNEKSKGGFTFGVKKARDDSTLTPGPGSYEYYEKQKMNTTYSYKIGTSRRLDVINEKQSLD